MKRLIVQARQRRAASGREAQRAAQPSSVDGATARPAGAGGGGVTYVTSSKPETKVQGTARGAETGGAPPGTIRPIRTGGAPTARWCATCRVPLPPRRPRRPGHPRSYCGPACEVAARARRDQIADARAWVERWEERRADEIANPFPAPVRIQRGLRAEIDEQLAERRLEFEELQRRPRTAWLERPIDAAGTGAGPASRPPAPGSGAL